MTDRFRYLPCALHSALARPDWAKPSQFGPFTVIEAKPMGVRGNFDVVDLAHPEGWDRAVRAYIVIRGELVPESQSASFVVEASQNDGQMVFICSVWTGLASRGARVPGMRAAPTTWPYVQPTDCREALCRCICAALSLDPDAVFPEATS